MTIHDAYNMAARITGTLPLGQEEQCGTCHTGTRLIVHGEYVVAHNPGCTDDPDNQAMKGSNTMDTSTLSPSEVAVRDALMVEPKTLVDLVKDLSLGATTVRRALKNLGATMNEDQTFKLDGTGSAKVTATAKKAAPTKATGKAAKQPPTATKAPAKKAPATKKAAPPGNARSREIAQARDASILDVLKQHKDGLTREQLVEITKIEPASLVPMSLWRLNKAGKVTKVVGGSRQPVWHAA